MIQTSHAARSRRIRHAVRRDDPTFCRTNGCATRLLFVTPTLLRCPICGSTVNLATARPHLPA